MNKKLALFFIVSSIITAGCSTTSTQYRRSSVNGNGAKSGAVRLSDDQYMVKQGDTYTAWYSVDGKKFVKMGTAKAILDDIRAGVTVCGGVTPMRPQRMENGVPVVGGFPAPEPFVAAFDEFKIVSGGLK